MTYSCMSDIVPVLPSRLSVKYRRLTDELLTVVPLLASFSEGGAHLEDPRDGIRAKVIRTLTGIERFCGDFIEDPSKPVGKSNPLQLEFLQAMGTFVGIDCYRALLLAENVEESEALLWERLCGFRGKVVSMQCQLWENKWLSDEDASDLAREITGFRLAICAHTTLASFGPRPKRTKH